MVRIKVKKFRKVVEWEDNPRGWVDFKTDSWITLLIGWFLYWVLLVFSMPLSTFHVME